MFHFLFFYKRYEKKVYMDTIGYTELFLIPFFRFDFELNRRFKFCKWKSGNPQFGLYSKSVDIFIICSSRAFIWAREALISFFRFNFKRLDFFSNLNLIPDPGWVYLAEIRGWYIDENASLNYGRYCEPMLVTALMLLNASSRCFKIGPFRSRAASDMPIFDSQ